MPPLTVTAVITAQDRREFLPQAIASAAAAGADEIVVVRNFSDPVATGGAPWVDVRCDLPPTGAKQALGVESAHGDVIALLDDDDLWEPNKVARLREEFARRPELVYFDHAQQAIDRDGRPVRAAHAEYVGKDPARFAATAPDDLWTLTEHVWPGNSSSTAVRRAWALGWLPTLRAAGWSADFVWFVAALLDGPTGVGLSPEPLTRLRLHGANMSQSRGVTPEEFRRRHGEQNQRWAGAYRVLTQLAVQRRGPTSPMARYLAENTVAFEFQRDLELGEGARSAAWRALREGPGPRRRGIWGVAGVSLFAPSIARRLLYRAGERRSVVVPIDPRPGASP
jgi:hypothetical protein